MKCSVCGSDVVEGHKFCANCGSPVAVAAASDAVNSASQSAAAVGAGAVVQPSDQAIAPQDAQAGWDQQAYYQQPPQGQPYGQQPYGQQPYGQPYQQYQQPAKVWPEQPATSRALAMSVYAGLLPLIFGLCVRDRNDTFMTHHLNQALVIFIGSIISVFLSVIVIGAITGLFFFVMMILGMVRAYQSSMEEMPLIGQIHLIK